MKLFLIKFSLYYFLLSPWTTVLAQVKLVSWNKTFGKSKSDVEINFIANTLGAYDIVLSK
jgi:hypothetical protein